MSGDTKKELVKLLLLRFCGAMSIIIIQTPDPLFFNLQQKAERLATRSTRPPITGPKKIGQRSGKADTDFAIAGKREKVTRKNMVNGCKPQFVVVSQV